jgi:thiol:disulfide interchange protein DsbA
MPILKHLTLFIIAVACSLPAIAEVEVKGAVEGVHYELIKPAQPTSAPEGQVEITELFWYGCPHCFRFEPYVKGWLKKKSDKIVFRRVPAVLSPKWETHARAFYAAEIMGVLEKMHEPLFLALHVQKKRIYKEEDVLDFIESLGIDRGQFEKTYKSFAVSSKIQQSKRLGQAYNITGVPSIVVNGKYLTSATHAGGFKELIVLMNTLALNELEKAGPTEAGN